MQGGGARPIETAPTATISASAWRDLNSRLIACEDYLISGEPMKAYRELLHARQVFAKVEGRA